MSSLTQLLAELCGPKILQCLTFVATTESSYLPGRETLSDPRPAESIYPLCAQH